MRLSLHEKDSAPNKKKAAPQRQVAGSEDVCGLILHLLQSSPQVMPSDTYSYLSFVNNHFKSKEHNSLSEGLLSQQTVEDNGPDQTDVDDEEFGCNTVYSVRLQQLRKLFKDMNAIEGSVSDAAFLNEPTKKYFLREARTKLGFGLADLVSSSVTSLGCSEYVAKTHYSSGRKLG
eukprot:CAMPEP_0176007106 /NCGR_PEP_ID=MMETSP0120_2-20121206/3061_1 /TAXON_ID=160619 /ORGANISM="Kryptoperidinium foliaceum, Strain CCMP 1326" /LENGTH=174 /DNA_ID=CAMNT_0017339855 /DNA_START=280 /DNA_END=804 /DNA_ORIENTATION=-